MIDSFDARGARHVGRTFLLAALTSSAFAMPTFPVAAQSTADNAATPVEEVVVTGSRVRQSNLTTPTPISVVTSDDIRFAGYNSVGQVLSLLPSTVASTGPQTTGNSLFGAGQYNIDIRGLGINRTLVLINGRRHNSGSFTSAAVDLNAFPSGYIDHIDVVTGGASAAYGSEAVAGVVNIITRKDLDGIEFDTQDGISSRSDGANTSMSLLAGQHFLNNRLYTIFSGEWNLQEPVNATDRSYTFPGILYNALVTPQVIIPNGPFTSTPLTAGGAFPTIGVYVSSDHKRVGRFTPDCLPGTNQCQNPDFPNLNIYNNLVGALHRKSADNYTEFKITDQIKVFTELEYFDANAFNTRFQPAFYSGSQLTLRNDNGFLQASDPVATALRSALAQSGRTSSPGNIFFDDVGQRIQDQHRIELREVGGVEGAVNVLNRNIHWDIYWEHGTLEGTTYGLAQFNRANMNFALDSILDPTSGNVVCRSAAARAAGCIPYDFIHGPSQASLKYVGATSVVFGKLEENNAAVNVTSDIVQLPGGPLGIAIGGEYRREFSDQRPDAQTAQGLLFTNQIAETRGAYSVQEAYIDAVVPLVRDLPFLKSASIEGLARTAEYSTAGSTLQYNLGGDVVPTDDVRFRTNFARAVRAPNVAELYSPLNDNFAAFNDPCDKSQIPLAPSPSLRVQNCSAQIPGYNPATFTSNARPGGVTVHLLQGGNPGLKPETANTFTAGAVVTPRWIQGFSLTADYYYTTVRNAITTLPLATVATFCYDVPGNPATNRFCQLFRRDPTGTGNFTSGIPYGIDSILLNNLNIAQLHVSGMDYELSYRFGMESLFSTARWHVEDPGDVRIDVKVTNTQTYKNQGDPSKPPLSSEDFIGYPRFAGIGSVAWSNDDWGFEYRNHYISPVRVTTTLSPNVILPYKAKSYFTNDLELIRYFNESLIGRIGVRNVADAPPPQNPNTYLASTAGGLGNAGASTYDSIGRFYYVGLTLRY